MTPPSCERMVNCCASMGEVESPERKVKLRTPPKSELVEFVVFPSGENCNVVFVVVTTDTEEMSLHEW
jgi:hypothetical protein